MGERYEPTSDFLSAIIAGNVPLSGSEWADRNLLLLLEMTTDDDPSNRDWAVFLLAQEDIDTPVVRDALLFAADDHDEIVRAEAMCGLAKRNVSLALPFVQRALQADHISVPALEAATLCAHPSLIADLRDWVASPVEPFFVELAADALAACETAGSSKTKF